MAERNRIKKIVAEHRTSKPNVIQPSGKRKDNNFQLAVWEAVDWEMKKLTDPSHGQSYVEMQPIARIDEE